MKTDQEKLFRIGIFYVNRLISTFSASKLFRYFDWNMDSPAFPFFAVCYRELLDSQDAIHSNSYQETNSSCRS